MKDLPQAPRADHHPLAFEGLLVLLRPIAVPTVGELSEESSGLMMSNRAVGSTFAESVAESLM